MSLIIAACSRAKIVIAGDTQLNDDNGPISFTGMKVIPIGNSTVAGLSGEYEGYMKVADYFSAKPELYSLSFQEKADTIINILINSGISCNFLLAGFEDSISKVVCTGKDYRYRYNIELVSTGLVRTLLPPDITDAVCRPYFTSIQNLKTQTINCICAASRISQSVNDKICGFEITPHDLQCFTYGINYDDISIHLTHGNS